MSSNRPSKGLALLSILSLLVLAMAACTAPTPSSAVATVQAAAPTIQAAATTMQAAAPTVQAAVPTLQAAATTAAVVAQTSQPTAAAAVATTGAAMATAAPTVAGMATSAAGGTPVATGAAGAMAPVLPNVGSTPTPASSAVGPAATNVAAAAADTTHQKPFTIGISNGFVASEWRTQMIQDLQTTNNEYKQQGLTNDLVIESADVDVAGQTQQIRNLINRGVDAIIINPNSQTALCPVIKEAQTAGIVVVAVDQEISCPDSLNVVIDQTEWARISMRWLADQLNGQGNIVIINGVSGHPANEARYDGVKQVLAQYPNIKVLNVVNANWDQATGQQAMSNLLASQPNINGVWTQDGMAQGALQAVVAANPATWPIMVGEARAGYIQLWQQVLQAKPTFTSTGVVNPPGVGTSGLRMALELLQGKQLKDGLLRGAFNNSLFVPIPGVVDQSNFPQVYSQAKDKPAGYSLDGIISQAEAAAYFK